MTGLRMLYVGYLREGETSLQRLKAFQRLGFDVLPLDVMKRPEASAWRRLGFRLANRLFRLGLPVPLPDVAGVNRALRELFHDAGPFEWVWMDKPLLIRPETIRTLRSEHPTARWAAFSPDDMGQRHNQSQSFLDILPLLDLFVTTKSFLVAELKALGDPCVLFMDNGFDPETHRPVPVTPEIREKFGGPVGFIGSYEKERASYLMYLATQGIPVRVWGGISWRRCPWRHPNLRLEYRELVGPAYAPAICSFDINLCFLRKMNRDRQTTRSVEIPACGAFMLAERTEEHRRLFREDEEAVFFGSREELLEKCRYYLDHPEERQAIAEKGLARCRQGGYDYPSRLREVLSRFEELRKKR